MSKLDYVTIAIVAICILAIVFFVYKMTDLFGDKKAADKIENVVQQVETEDDIYDGSESETEEADDTSDETTSTEDESNGSAATDEDNAPSSSEEDLEDEEDYDEGSSASENENVTKLEDIKPTGSYSSTGKYMVIAGTFTKRGNAKNHAASLRGMGYEHANVESFDRGKYAVVLVDRFNTMSSAERLVTSLKKDGVKSYVKAKR